METKSMRVSLCFSMIPLSSVLPSLPPFLPQIAERKPALKRTLVVVFIANEENNSVVDIGVDGLMKAGALEQIKKGPLFWVCMSSLPFQISWSSGMQR